MLECRRLKSDQVDDVRIFSFWKLPSGIQRLAMGLIVGRDAPTTPREASIMGQYSVGVKISRTLLGKVLENRAGGNKTYMPHLTHRLKLLGCFSILAYSLQSRTYLEQHGKGRLIYRCLLLRLCIAR